MSEREWTQGTHGRCNVVSFDGEEIRPVATFVLAEEAELACRLQSESAALRAQVERLENRVHRLEVAAMGAQEAISTMTNRQTLHPDAWQREYVTLAAVLRETEVDTEPPGKKTIASYQIENTPNEDDRPVNFKAEME